MRYCLGCRHFSADGPLCTHCGRSFGGRRCHGKKHHLNPPDAQVCGQCGTTDLSDAAASLGCSIRVFVVVLTVALLWWGRDHLIKGGRRTFHTLFYRWTGFHNPLVWLVEQFANVLIILFVFYFLSLFMPGEAGQKFRELISKLSLEALKFTFQFGTKVVCKLLILTGQLLVGPTTKEKNPKK